MARSAPEVERVDTCIVGNGPSALILSYILHGHVPVYRGQHRDEILHSKLGGHRDLLHLTSDLYAHFQSSLRYSTAALPINTLLDTLMRPNADTEVDPKSLIEWTHEPSRAVTHIALGSAPRAGGQWTDDALSASSDIGSLSYAEMLSLPGYSFGEHYRRQTGEVMPEFMRPSRNQVAGYYASYPAAVGIEASIFTGTDVSFVSRSSTGERFVVQAGPRIVESKHLVLASGTFSVGIPPPSPLESLIPLDTSSLPLLVIGSGFSAADAIISASSHQRVIHIYNWDPENRPSPLRGCHRLAYPEYAGVYQQMKHVAQPLLARRRSVPWLVDRDWDAVYEGHPNSEVSTVKLGSDGTAVVRITTADGEVIERDVGGLRYVVGRRGLLDYLEDSLFEEVVGATENRAGSGSGSVKAVDHRKQILISGRTLRLRAEQSLEVAPGVFVIGSLAGDSLVRHAFGSCVYAAGRIMGAVKRASEPRVPASSVVVDAGDAGDARRPSMAHSDLHLDRRKMGSRRRLSFRDVQDSVVQA